jgi:uncharacterized alpha-E superfamily protein
MESMTRTQAFRFLDLGRRLERALQIIILIKNTLISGNEREGPVLQAILEAADSLMTYRSRYMSNLRLGAVLDLLLTDETNPRSVAFQLVSISEHIQQLPRDQLQPGYGPEQRIAMSLLHGIRMVDIRVVTKLNDRDAVDYLGHVLGEMEANLPKLSEAISHKYLIHAGPARQLAAIRPG